MNITTQNKWSYPDEASFVYFALKANSIYELSFNMQLRCVFSSIASYGGITEI